MPTPMLIPPDRSRLRENIFSLFTLQFATLAAPLISVPYLVRVLEPGNYGRIAVAQAFVQYLVLLTEYGFNLSATRQVAASSNDAERLSELISSVFIVKSSLALVGFLLLICAVAYVPLFEQDWPLYLVTFLFVLGNLASLGWLYQGLERMRILTACQLVAQALGLVAVFVFVREPGDYRMAAAIQGATPIISGCAGFVVIRRYISFRLGWPGFDATRRFFSEGWHVFASTLAVSIYSNTTILVVGAVTNPSVAGHFAAAERLIRAVQALLTPISQAAYPHIARLSAVSTDASLLFIRKLLRIQGLLALTASVVLFALADPLVHLLFGRAFAPTVVLVQWMATVPFVVGISNVLGVQTMLNFGMQRSFSAILVVSGIVSLGFVVSLTMYLGAKGAAISVLVTETAVASAMGVVLYRRRVLRDLLRPGVS